MGPIRRSRVDDDSSNEKESKKARLNRVTEECIVIDEVSDRSRLNNSSNKIDKPLKCKMCLQYLDDELKVYAGDSADAVSEVVMLTSPELDLYNGSYACDKPLLKVTNFAVYDEVGHLCLFDTGIIEKGKLLYFSGYVKPPYADDSITGGVYTTKMGPIDEWWSAGYDGGNALLGFSTQISDYIMMKPQLCYEGFIKTCLQKIKLTKLVIEFLQDDSRATFDDLLSCVQNSGYTQETLFANSQFIVSQIGSYDSAADEDEIRLLTAPCIRRLIHLSLVNIKGIKISSIKDRSEKSVVVKKSQAKPDTLATTTKLVYEILSTAFGDVLEAKDKCSIQIKAKAKKACRSCAACLSPPCGVCSGCKGKVKKCVKKICLSLAIQEADEDDVDSADESDDDMDKKAKLVGMSKFDTIHRKLKEKKTNVLWFDRHVAIINKVKYYQGVRVNNVLVRPGDCVMVVPDVVNCALYIAKICYMYENKQGDSLLHVNWFWRGSDTVLGDLAEEAELFITDDCDDIPAGSVACVCTVIQKKYSSDWNLTGGSDNPDSDSVIDANSDKQRTFFYQKWYDNKKCRFEDPPAAVKCNDEVSSYNFCNACYRRTLIEKEETPHFSNLLNKTSKRLTYSSVRLNGLQYNVGDSVFLNPEVFVFPTNWSSHFTKQVQEITFPKDEEKYPELYRSNKDGYRGRYHGSLEPFCIGRILSIMTDVGLQPTVETSYFRVAVFYRSENIPDGKSSVLEADFNLLYWSDEETTVSMDNVEGKCYVAHVSNVESLDTFRCAGPHRFYFEQGYSLKHKCYFEVPDNVKIYGKVIKNDDGKAVNAWEEYAPIKKRLRTFDIFAGCGGLSHGFHQAGISKNMWAIENNEEAAKAYKINNPHCTVFKEDCNILLKHVMEGCSVDENGQDLPQKGEVDLLLGGPPCQGFSGMNRFNYRQYSLFKNSLIATYLSYCDYYRPRFFVLENVRNFVAYKKSMVLKLTLRCLIRMGYQCTFAVLQAGHYGVPQTRRRLIILAAAPGEQLPVYPEPLHVFIQRGSELSVMVDDTKFTSNIKWKKSAPYRPVTVRDAMSDLPEVENGCSSYEMSYGGPPLSHFQKILRENAKTLYDHVLKEMGSLVVARFRHIPVNCDWRHLPNISLTLDDGTVVKKLRYSYDDVKNGRSRKGHLRGVCICAEGKEPCDPFDRQLDTLIPWCLPHTGNRHNNWAGLYGRLDWDGYFCTTVTNPEPMGKQGSVVHPEQHRVVSVRECARSQGFPDSYKFAGSILDKHRQIGNAVPPPLAFAIATEIRKCLKF